MNFAKQDLNAKGIDVYSEEEWKMIWIRGTKIKLLMSTSLEKCRNELGWLARYEKCIVNNCPKEYFPLMPLPIPPGYTKKNGAESENGQK